MILLNQQAKFLSDIKVRKAQQGVSLSQALNETYQKNDPNNFSDIQKHQAFVNYANTKWVNPALRGKNPTAYDKFQASLLDKSNVIDRNKIAENTIKDNNYDYYVDAAQQVPEGFRKKYMEAREAIALAGESSKGGIGNKLIGTGPKKVEYGYRNAANPGINEFVVSDLGRQSTYDVVYDDTTGNYVKKLKGTTFDKTHINPYFDKKKYADDRFAGFEQSVNTTTPKPTLIKK